MRIDRFAAVLTVLAASGAVDAGVGPDAPPSAAKHSLLERTTANVARAHAVAARHSSRLARDLRVTFAGLLATRDDSGAQRVLEAGHKLYCTTPNNRNSANGGGGDGSQAQHANGTSSSSGSATKTGSRTSSAGAAPTAVLSSDWKIFQSYTGDDFFNDWDWWSYPDPTKGIVDYQTSDDARSAGLAYTNDAGNFIMKVETTPQVSKNRKSVRIHSKAVFNGGIIVLDALHMPQGCGAWPAFWSNGPNWPKGGEIDIVEGVHDYVSNQATIHTTSGCTLPSRSSKDLGISGTLVAQTNCDVDATGNQGCGTRAADKVSFGAGFNNNGGGVYAMKWDNNGISVYFWPPGQTPDDLMQEAPNPDKWGLPMANFPSNTCDPWKFFTDHIAIFDTTLCGDWASGAWSSAGIPGQEQSCAQRTGVNTCEEYVRKNGASFDKAYWEVRSVKMFQKK